MPVKIGKKKFKGHRAAASHIRRTRPGVTDPDAYVAAIEHKQKKARKKKGGR